MHYSLHDDDDDDDDELVIKGGMKMAAAGRQYLAGSSRPVVRSLLKFELTQRGGAYLGELLDIEKH